ncbi:MAG: hypothetical protein H7Z40_10580, partial [Phycisphaerae bacterium]|nr:hypothetical protein [Gemmatimonadaceae bacterium]
MQNESQPAPAPTPGVQVEVIQDGQVVQTGTGIAGAPSARDMYLAAKAYRDELQDQWERLRSTRANVAEATREESRTSVDIAGLEKRMSQLDERILDVEKQIASADARVAQAAGVPGATEEPYIPRDNSVNVEDVLAGGAFLSFALLFPFVIAYSRRIWRR